MKEKHKRNQVEDLCEYEYRPGICLQGRAPLANSNVYTTRLVRAI